MLIVKRIRGRGRGVVTTTRIMKGELVHVSPVLVLHHTEVRGAVARYVWQFPGNVRVALALGLGSLFNHSRAPNVAPTLRPARQEIAFWAEREIAAGEELTVDYGYEPRGYDGR